MKLAVRAGLASLECLTAVEKCSRLGWRRVSELKFENHGSTRVRSMYTEPFGICQNGNPGSETSIRYLP